VEAMGKSIKEMMLRARSKRGLNLINADGIKE